MDQETPASDSGNDSKQHADDTVIRNAPFEAGQVTNADRSSDSEDLSFHEPRLTLVRSSFMTRGYEVLGEIGRGGMGVVYKARDSRLKRLVALKMILSGDHAGQRELERFRSEAETLARVEHPGIVQVYEVGELQGHPYLALEYVDGGSLTDFTGRKPVDALFAARIVVAVARAVQAAHDQGIAHRDLKPDNILLLRRPATNDSSLSDRSGIISASSPILNPATEVDSCLPIEQLSPKVADFGLAKQMDVPDQLTRTGAILGSPNYMAPEQASGDIREVGFAADIYALGAVLYYMLTGRPPFLATTAAETILMVRDDNPVAPTQLQPRLSRDIETICLKCLEKNPGKRFESARELKDELARFTRGEPILSRPLTPATRAWRWCRRNFLVATLLSAVAVSLAATVVISITAALWMANSAEQEKAARHIAEDRLIQIHTTSGLRLIDQGSLPDSLPWFAEAIRLVEQRESDSGRSDSSSIHRLRLAAVMRQCPKYSQLWFEDNFLHQCEFSADGKTVIASGKSGLVRVWDVQSGEPAGPELLHPDDVRFSAISPAGQLIATACQDGVLRLWDISTGKLHDDSMRHEDGIYHISFDPTGRRLVSASKDGSARIWDVETGGDLFELAHDGPVLRASFSPQGSLVLTASGDGTARIWDADTGLPTARLQHEKEVRDAVWSDDGELIATASRDNTARVWNSNGEPLSPPLAHGAVLTSVHFSHDALRVVTASEDRTARVWDALSGEPMTPPMEHDDYVSEASFSPDGRFILTASEDSNAVIWDSRTGARVGQPLRHNDRVTGARYAPNGRQILTRVTRRAAVWDLASIEESARQFQHENTVLTGTISPDGKRVATGDADGVARVWSVDDPLPLAGPLVHQFPIQDLQFAHGGKWLVAVGAGNDRHPHPHGELRVWDSVSGQLLHVEWFDKPAKMVRVGPNDHHIAVVTGNTAVVLNTNSWQRVLEAYHAKDIFSIDFHPHFNWLVSGSYDKSAQVWDLDSGLARGEPFRHEGRVDCVEFSADGRLLLTTCSGEGENSYTQIWNVTTHSAISTHSEPDSFYLLSATFSPSLNHVASCLSNSAVIRETISGNRIGSPMRHTGMVQDACFSPDGMLLATASWDNTARVWDVMTGQPVSPPLVHDDWVTHVEFSPDGEYLLTVSRDQEARLWDMRGTDGDVEHLKLVSESLSNQRASEGGMMVDIGVADAQQRWRTLRAENSPFLQITESQVATWNLQQLKDSVRERDWKAVVYHSQQITQSYPDRIDVWIDRGLAHAELEDWSSATADLAAADNADVSVDYLCDYAMVALASGDTQRYARICQRLADRTDDSLVDRSLASILIACTLDPGSSVDWSNLIDVAQTRASHELSPRMKVSQAMAMYRAGRFRDSLECLNAESQSDRSRGYADIILRDILMAMALHRIGDEQASVRLAEIKQTLDFKDSSPRWDQRLAVSTLLAEAEQVIGED